MVLVCSQCNARLQLDDAKAPPSAFTVRCPKCQTIINVTANTSPPSATVQAGASPAPVSSDTSFARPASAARFNARAEDAETISPSEAAPAIEQIAKFFAEAVAHKDSQSNIGSRRSAWERRKALVCSSPAYRETIAEALAKDNYEVFVAENLAQGLGKMREEHMDVVVLEANFDPIEQGVAFITREVRLMRPSLRRRLFLVYVTSGVRTMDLHAAFVQNVNLLVNPSDIDQLSDALEISLRQYNELYKPLFRALDVASI